ncbi:MAG TPA: hypothetical protein VD972_10350, partial [Hyalangium sp.]|nr:hypothetical protein [Hyalangium sp.]
PSTAPKPRAVRRALPAWLSSGIAAAVGGMMGVAFFELQYRRGREDEPPPLIVEEWHAPPVDTPDAGVGEKALLSAAQSQRPASSFYVLGLPMPKGPQPGQKKPPCDLEAEVAALGACWVIIKKDPPCGAVAYDLAGHCVRATFEAPRQPTSEQP